MSVLHKADEYSRALLDLDRLRKLPKNWDQQGAPAISKRAIDEAVNLVRAFQRDRSAPAPRVVAMCDGGVELAWAASTDHGRLEIEARFVDEGNTLLIGLAHSPGFIFDGPVHGTQDFVQRIRDTFKEHSPVL